MSPPAPSAAARDPLQPLNPLAQVPVLVLPDGGTMTESAAITLHLADLTGRDDLVPGPQAPERAAFLRWLIFIVANIYPTFTYGDVPTRFVGDDAAAKGFRSEIDACLRRLWTLVETAAGTPCFLGERFCALDIYLSVMTNWRPGKAWFAENTPRLSAAALRAASQANLAPAIGRNFPKRG